MLVSAIFDCGCRLAVRANCFRPKAAQYACFCSRLSSKQAASNLTTVPTCGVLVELVEAVPDTGREVAARQPSQPQPRGRHRLALLPHILALALLQRAQEVLEAGIPSVLPAPMQCLDWILAKVRSGRCNGEARGTVLRVLTRETLLQLLSLNVPQDMLILILKSAHQWYWMLVRCR